MTFLLETVYFWEEQGSVGGKVRTVLTVTTFSSIIPAVETKQYILLFVLSALLYEVMNFLVILSSWFVWTFKSAGLKKKVSLIHLNPAQHYMVLVTL